MANTQAEEFNRAIKYFETFDYDTMMQAREHGTTFHPDEFRMAESECFNALRVLQNNGCPANFNYDYYNLLIEKLTTYSVICNEIAMGFVGLRR